MPVTAPAGHPSDLTSCLQQTSFKMSSKGSSTDGRTELANGSLSSSLEEMSGADEGRETSSGNEVEASDMSLTGNDGGPNRTSTETESSGEEKDSDSMEDTGYYSINDES
ncbi:DDB1- and CUL4-associated factor 8 [Fukomys damarensis]|uniref:DDB1-and CUL4-associated factor 8 n=1 Tax=Fukomys damarensis TaxID=885580 RepID=A0A091CRZ1_FUKDA|nr:DDB1- and CUL4-associated factor 8 [Fukomys damarensis]